MGQKNLTFEDFEIENYCHKGPIFMEDVDIEQVLVSNKIPFGEKAISTLLATCIMMIKLSHYLKCFLKKALM